MTRDELWQTFVARNPALAGDGHVRVSVDQLRRMFDLTWDAAQSAAYRPEQPDSGSAAVQFLKDIMSGKYKSPN